MTVNKPFHLKIKWKDKEKTEAYEIVLYDGGQPLGELLSVDDARLIRDLLNETKEEIKRQQIVIHEVANAIMDDIRTEVNEEFLEVMENYNTLDEMKKDMEKNLKWRCMND